MQCNEWQNWVPVTFLARQQATMQATEIKSDRMVMCYQTLCWTQSSWIKYLWYLSRYPDMNWRFTKVPKNVVNPIIEFSELVWDPSLLCLSSLDEKSIRVSRVGARENPSLSRLPSLPQDIQSLPSARLIIQSKPYKMASGDNIPLQTWIQRCPLPREYIFCCLGHLVTRGSGTPGEGQGFWGRSK